MIMFRKKNPNELSPVLITFYVKLWIFNKNLSSDQNFLSKNPGYPGTKLCFLLCTIV